MRSKLFSFIPALGLTLALLTAGVPAWADELVLKNGQAYSGRFVRGDKNVIEFRMGDRIESFQTLEVSQILFKKPAQTVRAEPIVPREAQPPRNAPVPRQTRSRDRDLPQASESAKVTFPVGTSIRVRTLDSIDTKYNQIGDSFSATMESPLIVGSQVIVPRGAQVRGKIAYAKESGRVAGRSELALELTEIHTNGKQYLLRTSEYIEVGTSQGKRTAKTVGGTAALGAIIGAIAGGGKGAAIGGTAGAAAGGAARVLTKGETLRVPPETLLEFKLDSPLSVDVP